MAERIQRKRTKGWRMPINTVYVGRPSKWGNPHRVGLCPVCGIEHPDKPSAVAAFRETAAACFDLPLDLIRGKDLACWCKPGEPCHADVLLEIANA